MKRIIKFRAWEKPDPTVKFEGKMHYDIQSVLDKWLDSDDYEIMQFTGLLDKSGKEIYEGDIVEWKHPNSYGKEEVKWVNTGFYIPGVGTNYSEIIGNIYENSELLK